MIGQPKPNQDIRDLIQRKGLFRYEVASKLGISVTTFTYRLQKPLSEKQRNEILTAIVDLAK